MITHTVATSAIRHHITDKERHRHRHRTTIANQNQQLLQLLSFPPALTPKNAGAMTYHNIHIKRILSLHQVAHRSVHHPKTPLNQMKKKQLREEKGNKEKGERRKETTRKKEDRKKETEKTLIQTTDLDDS